jgi:GMP synthase-like glutamine amidotransferase
MNILAIVHEPPPCSGVFADPARERGDVVEEWSLAWGTPPARPLDEYGAVMIFGGLMDTHEEDDHPWLVDEDELIRTFLARGTPTIGVCLGGQLIAKATGTRVSRIEIPEIGFADVDLLPDAREDPLFHGLDDTLKALEWHHYCFDLPAGAVPLARNAACLQAYRVGEAAWGLQFHAETTYADWIRWVEEWDALPDADRTAFDPVRLKDEAERHMEQWNEFGREISRRFLELAANGAGA